MVIDLPGERRRYDAIAEQIRLPLEYPARSQLAFFRLPVEIIGPAAKQHIHT